MTGGRLAFALAALATSAPARGESDFYARGHGGFYRSQEKFAEGDDKSADAQSNDQEQLLGSLFLDATGVGPFANELVLDVRDKFDSFGALDPEAPRLVESHAPELRQLAVKYPFEGESLTWSLGRFTIPEAGLIGNDGAELAYKLTSTSGVGVFGGLYPERQRGHAIPVSEASPQAGLYAFYQQRTTEWGRNVYASTGVVMRQVTEPVEADDADAAADPESVEPEEATFSRGIWYANGNYQPSPATRISLLSHVDVTPEMHVRNLWVSGFRQILPRTSVTVSALTLDLTEYEKRRELRDTLPASGYNELRAQGKQKIGNALLADLQVASGSRSVDSKSRSTVFGRLAMTNLASGRLAIRAGGGVRKNFTSDDTFMRGGLSAYFRNLEVSLDQEMGTEKLEDGETLHPQITDLSASILLGERVILGLSGEYAKDERVTIMSGLLTAGFRMGRKQMTPTRERAPGVNRL